MILTSTEIKQIEELTGLEYDESRSILISSRKQNKYPNNNNTFKYVFDYGTALDFEGYPTGYGLKELIISNDGISYFHNDEPMYPTNMWIPFKWLVPLSKIFKLDPKPWAAPNPYVKLAEKHTSPEKFKDFIRGDSDA